MAIHRFQHLSLPRNDHLSIGSLELCNNSANILGRGIGAGTALELGKHGTRMFANQYSKKSEEQGAKIGWAIKSTGSEAVLIYACAVSAPYIKKSFVATTALRLAQKLIPMCIMLTIKTASWRHNRKCGLWQNHPSYSSMNWKFSLPFQARSSSRKQHYHTSIAWVALPSSLRSLRVWESHSRGTRMRIGHRTGSQVLSYLKRSSSQANCNRDVLCQWPSFLN